MENKKLIKLLFHEIFHNKNFEFVREIHSHNAIIKHRSFLNQGKNAAYYLSKSWVDIMPNIEMNIKTIFEVDQTVLVDWNIRTLLKYIKVDINDMEEITLCGFSSIEFKNKLISASETFTNFNVCSSNENIRIDHLVESAKAFYDLNRYFESITNKAVSDIALQCFSLWIWGIPIKNINYYLPTKISLHEVNHSILMFENIFNLCNRFEIYKILCQSNIVDCALTIARIILE